MGEHRVERVERAGGSDSAKDLLAVLSKLPVNVPQNTHQTEAAGGDPANRLQTASLSFESRDAANTPEISTYESRPRSEQFSRDGVFSLESHYEAELAVLQGQLIHRVADGSLAGILGMGVSHGRIQTRRIKLGRVMQILKGIRESGRRSITPVISKLNAGEHVEDEEIERTMSEIDVALAQLQSLSRLVANQPGYDRPRELLKRLIEGLLTTKSWIKRNRPGIASSDVIDVEILFRNAEELIGKVQETLAEETANASAIAGALIESVVQTRHMLGAVLLRLTDTPWEITESFTTAIHALELAEIELRKKSTTSESGETSGGGTYDFDCASAT